MTVMYLQVRLKRIIAVVRIDSDLRDLFIVECSNMEFCRGLRISNEGCPAYCEVVVAAKDFAYGRRRPKANVIEISENDIEIEV